MLRFSFYHKTVGLTCALPSIPPIFYILRILTESQQPEREVGIWVGSRTGNVRVPDGSARTFFFRNTRAVGPWIIGRSSCFLSHRLFGINRAVTGNRFPTRSHWCCQTGMRHRSCSNYWYSGRRKTIVKARPSWRLNPVPSIFAVGYGYFPTRSNPGSNHPISW